MVLSLAQQFFRRTLYAHMHDNTAKVENRLNGDLVSRR